MGGGSVSTRLARDDGRPLFALPLRADVSAISRDLANAVMRVTGEAIETTLWVVALVAVGIVAWVARRRVVSSRRIDAGAVSEGWLREQRAEKRRD
jgi:hypothetical protein